MRGVLATTTSFSALIATGVIISVAGPVFAAPTTSPAADKQRCVDAATRGQIQRDDQKLGAAAEAFAVCAEKPCPAAVRQSCSEWLADVQSKMPNVTVHLTDASVTAAAARDLRVEIDGNATSLDTAMTLDPGTHKVHVESPQKKEPFEQQFSLAVKENKTINVLFPIEQHITVATPPPPKIRPVPRATYILGGVALVGITSFLTFGLIAKSKTNHLSEECAPACSTSAKNNAFRVAAIADISLSVAIISAAVGTVLYLTRPSIVVGAEAPKTGASSLLPAFSF